MKKCIKNLAAEDFMCAVQLNFFVCRLNRQNDIPSDFYFKKKCHVIGNYYLDNRISCNLVITLKINGLGSEKRSLDNI